MTTAAVAGDFEDGMKSYVSQDYAKAAQSFVKAAERGDASAQFVLGNMYENGEGVKQDYQQAMSWYRKAAELGNASAQSNLGTMYEHGEGAVKDLRQAMSWYLKAAMQGNAQAQSNLGVLYAKGEGGVPHDYIEADKWFRIAESGGIEKAKEQRDFVERFMTSAQLDEAQRRVRDWASEWIKAHPIAR
jgi:hypothetical protein